MISSSLPPAAERDAAVVRKANARQREPQGRPGKQRCGGYDAVEASSRAAHLGELEGAVAIRIELVGDRLEMEKLARTNPALKDPKAYHEQAKAVRDEANAVVGRGRKLIYQR